MWTIRAAIAAVLLALTFSAGPASAGGPTSAILSVPGEGATASLYYTDGAYDQLARLVGAYNTTAGRTDTSGASHESGAGVNVTWLIHDVQPWRVDRIYLNADGGPWIATQVMDSDTGSIWDSPVVWHQPTEGKELSMLLDRLLAGTAPARVPTQAAAPVVAPETPVAEPAEASDQASGLWWGLGGLAAGVLLTLGWLRLHPTRDEEPVPEDGSVDRLAPASRTP